MSIRMTFRRHEPKSYGVEASEAARCVRMGSERGAAARQSTVGESGLAPMDILPGETSSASIVAWWIAA